MPNNILHLVPASDFRALPDAEPYFPSAFAADGFIHCTREPEMMLQIANRFDTDIHFIARTGYTEVITDTHYYWRYKL